MLAGAVASSLLPGIVARSSEGAKCVWHKDTGEALNRGALTHSNKQPVRKWGLLSRVEGRPTLKGCVRPDRPSDGSGQLPNCGEKVQTTTIELNYS